MTSQADRIAGGLWGLFIGDAFGVLYEFHDPESLPVPRQNSYFPRSLTVRASPPTLL